MMTKRVLSGSVDRSCRWFKKSVAFLINDGIKLLSMYLVKWTSTKTDSFSIAIPLPDIIGLPKLSVLCTLGKKYK